METPLPIMKTLVDGNQLEAQTPCAFCSQRMSSENLESETSLNQSHLKSICGLLHLSWRSFEPYLKSTIRQKLKSPADDLPLALQLCYDCESWVLYVLDLYEKLETARKKIIKILQSSATISIPDESGVQAQVNSIAHQILKQCFSPCEVKAEKLPEAESCLELIVTASPEEELMEDDADEAFEDSEFEPTFHAVEELENEVEPIQSQPETESTTRPTRLGRQAKKRAYTFMRNIIQKTEKENVTNVPKENEGKLGVQDKDWKATEEIEVRSTDTAATSRKRRRILAKNPPNSLVDSKTGPISEPEQNVNRKRTRIRTLKPAKFTTYERARRLKKARMLKPDMFLRGQPNNADFNCEACDATFAYSPLLDIHKLEAHRTEPDESTSAPNLLTFDCYICGDRINQEAYRIVTDMDQQGFRYVTLANGQEHVHENFTALSEFHIQLHYLDAPKPRDRSSRDQSKKGHPFACSICPYTFKTQKRLDVHKIHHLEEKPYKCIVCSDSFHTETPLHSHLSKVHSIEVQMMDRYSCRRCLQVFVSADPDKSSGQMSSEDSEAFQNFVKEHLPCLKRPYLTQRQLQCKFCQEYFKTPFKLYSHEVKVHTRDYKYYCDQCGLPLLTALRLYFHRRQVHPVVEQTFHCDKCPSVFRGKGNLTQHMRIHDSLKPFECSLCKKAFYTKSKCQNHERTHSAERTFACPTCGKLFRTKSEVQRHDSGVHQKMGKSRPYRPRKKNPIKVSANQVYEAAHDEQAESRGTLQMNNAILAEAVRVDEAELAEAFRGDDSIEEDH